MDRTLGDWLRLAFVVLLMIGVVYLVASGQHNYNARMAAEQAEEESP